MSSERELSDLFQKMIRKLDKIADSGSSSFASYGGDSQFVRDGNTSHDPITAVRSTTREMDNFRDSIRNVMDINKKIFKSMLDGIPVYGKYNKAVRDATEEIKKQSKGQSDAFKKSAHAMNEFVSNVGANSKSFEKVTNTMAKVYDSTNKLKDLTKKRTALESEINSSLKRLGVRQEKIDSEYRDIPKVLKNVKERIKAETDKGTKRELEQTKKKLEKLNEIPEAVAQLSAVMNDNQLKKLAEKHPELKSILDPLFKRLDTLLRVEELGYKRSTSIDELESKLEDSTESNDGLKGALSSSTTWMQKLGKMFDERSRDLERALNNLRKSLGAALGESISKEANLLMIRQRFTGNTNEYSARIPALTMGMSEADLLGSVAENRNVIRRIAQDSGMAGGAGELLHSNQLRELQRLSREMGYMGKDGLDNIIKISDNLRVLGVNLDPKNIKDSVEFYRDTFKDLGITQEQMRRFFADMSSEGMLRVLSAGEDARLASIESMQDEVEFRGKLARVLNQELEIQQKRVRELAGLAYGGPGEAIKRSIGVQILAEQAGMDQSTVRLLGEQTRTGGVSLSGEERQAAATNYNRLVGDIGGLLHDAVRADDTGMRAMLTQVMGMAGVEGRDAVEAYIRRGGDLGELSVEDVLSSARAETERTASEVGKWGHATVTTLEHMQGALQSSIGKAAGGIISAIWEAVGVGISAGLASRIARHGSIIGGRGTRSFGRRAMGIGGKILRGGGPVALAGIAASSLAPEGPQGDLLRTGGNTVSGAGTGALLGSAIAPGLGTVIGAALGGLVSGGLTINANRKRGEERRRQQLMTRAVSHMAMGNFGAEQTPELTEREKQLRSDYEEAFRNNDQSRMRAIMNQLEHGSHGLRTRSLMENIDRFSNMRRGRLVPSGTTITNEMTGEEIPMYKAVETERSKRYARAIEEDITSYLDTEEFANLAVREPIEVLLRMIKSNSITLENEEDTIKMLNARLETIALNTELGYKKVDEGNQDMRNHFSKMSEDEIRNAIESSLTAQRNQAQNRIIGQTRNFSERE